MNDGYSLQRARYIVPLLTFSFICLFLVACSGDPPFLGTDFSDHFYEHRASFDDLREMISSTNYVRIYQGDSERNAGAATADDIFPNEIAGALGDDLQVLLEKTGVTFVERGPDFLVFELVPIERGGDSWRVSIIYSEGDRTPSAPCGTGNAEIVCGACSQYLDENWLIDYLRLPNNPSATELQCLE